MSSFPAVAHPRAGHSALSLPRERFQLRCGAKLLVSPRAGAPVTSAGTHLRGGVTLDPPGREGLAYLTGSLADQGTANHDEAEIAGLLEPAGGAVSGDATGIGGSIAGGDWKLLLDLICEMLTEASYPDDEVELHKGRLRTRLLALRDDPRAQGGRRFRRLVYGRTWLGRPSWGTLQSLERIGAADLRAHRESCWRPDRATIAVCGDVNPRTVRNFLERRLAGWQAGAPYEPKKPRLPAPGVRVDAFTKKREQVHVYLGHLGVRRKDPDYAALTVMDHVLGTGPGFANRITRRLRDELGLAYSVSADIHSSAGVHPGIFTAYIGTSPEHLETAVEGFLREMHRIRDEPVSAEELELAKSYLLGSFVLGFERATRRTSYLIASEVYGLPDDELEQLPRAFAAVSAEDVQRVARAHLFPDACCLAAAGPVSREELRALL